MSARISKTQASRSKLHGLIREVEILKAQNLKALKAIQTDAEYQALEDQIVRQSKLINQLRVDVAKAQDGQIDVNTIASGRVRAAEAATKAARLSLLVTEREVQNLNQVLRTRDGKLFDYRVVSTFLLAGTIVLGVTRFLGV